MLLSNFATGFQSNYSQTKNMAGNVAANFNCSFNNFATTQTSGHYGGAGQGPHVIVGGGDTPPTYDDYTLADLSILGNNLLKSIQSMVSWSKVGGNTFTTQWQNMSESPITVKEVALAFKYAANNPYATAVNYIVARKVLDTPIVIQPNEIYAFSYRLKFKQ